METNIETMEKIMNLCKRRGFVFPSSEIYGGFAATYDFGQVGMEIVLLLIGREKSTQTTDIPIAQTYWTEFRRRQL